MVNLANGDVWTLGELVTVAKLNTKNNVFSATDPTSTAMVWLDTSGAETLLKFRNVTNTAWIDYFNQAVKTTSGPTFDHLHLPTTGSGGGLIIGTATACTLYQSASDTLYTPNILVLDSTTDKTLTFAHTGYQSVYMRNYQGTFFIYHGTSSGTPNTQWSSTGVMLISNLAGSGSRTVVASSTGVLSAPASSLRYKNNINDISDTSWIYNLRPVNFEWNDSAEWGYGIQMGLIAEEVAEIYPQLTFNKDDLVEGVRYEQLVIPLLAELKKLRDRILELEKLTGRITELESKVN